VGALIKVLPVLVEAEEPEYLDKALMALVAALLRVEAALTKLQVALLVVVAGQVGLPVAPPLISLFFVGVSSTQIPAAPGITVVGVCVGVVGGQFAERGQFGFVLPGNSPTFPQLAQVTSNESVH